MSFGWRVGGTCSSACRFFSSFSCGGTSGCSSGRASSGRCRVCPSPIHLFIRTVWAALASCRASREPSRRSCSRKARCWLGTLANTILFEGKVLTSFYVEVVTFTAAVVFVVVGPLLAFMLPLAAAKRSGLREYRQFARRYVDEFDEKWLRGSAPRDEPLVGSADIQSLADLGNSFEISTQHERRADHVVCRGSTGYGDPVAHHSAVAHPHFARGAAQADCEGSHLRSRKPRSSPGLALQRWPAKASTDG